jgi:hypothetical protein
LQRHRTPLRHKRRRSVSIRQHTSAYEQHTSAYSILDCESQNIASIAQLLCVTSVSIRTADVSMYSIRTEYLAPTPPHHTTWRTSIRQHTSAYVQHASACTAYVQNTLLQLLCITQRGGRSWHLPHALASAYVSIRQHTSSIRQRMGVRLAPAARPRMSVPS